MNSQLEELASLYVLDRLEASERAAFEVRLLHNPELLAFVQELESTLARRIHLLPQVEPPAGLFERIEARIEQPLEKNAPPSVQPVIPWWTLVTRWGIAAAVVLGLGLVAVRYLRSPAPAADRPFVIIVGLDSRQSTLTELPLARNPGDADASFMQLASLAENFWEKPENLPIKLRSPGESGHSYALFDPSSNQGFIAIRQLPAIEQGKRYHLWILDTASGQVREAGVLPVRDSNRGLYFFSVEPNTEAKSGRPGFFVTAEDTNVVKPDQPRGKVVLGDDRI